MVTLGDEFMEEYCVLQACAHRLHSHQNIGTLWGVLRFHPPTSQLGGMRLSSDHLAQLASGKGRQLRTGMFSLQKTGRAGNADPMPQRILGPTLFPCWNWHQRCPTWWVNDKIYQPSAGPQWAAGDKGPQSSSGEKCVPVKLTGVLSMTLVPAGTGMKPRNISQEDTPWEWGAQEWITWRWQN